MNPDSCVAGIDAPETGQAFWRTAWDSLRSQLAQGAAIDCYKTDAKYGRQVCRVSGLDGHDIALELVKNGLAWHTVKYRQEQTATEQVTYAIAEGPARARNRGLWSQPDPQNPATPGWSKMSVVVQAAKQGKDYRSGRPGVSRFLETPPFNESSLPLMGELLFKLTKPPRACPRELSRISTSSNRCQRWACP